MNLKHFIIKRTVYTDIKKKVADASAVVTGHTTGNGTDMDIITSAA